ncbi:hypothetical protein DUNSADRAFT_17355 [Dunaliella salina]|uniref:Encoded protein n=1 Tax=Dunaliella salina TaxID=3046 RepID=A0ABQ7H069_DUNSA|nr:hypothetical protein DUNSADRAFT_17355 [Dunaliella salina]|eukprot:KAF5840252.1 hypothetical protein DUNSADRAFT_17355 [Dunaliella salina]
MQPCLVSRGKCISLQSVVQAGAATCLPASQQCHSSLGIQQHHSPAGSSLHLSSRQHLPAQLPLQEPNPAPSAQLPPLSTPFSLGYPGTWPPKSDEALLPGLPLAPSLECAVPKKKLSQHRQSHRRQWYHLQRIKEMQQCPHCKAVGGNNNLLNVLSSNCNGMCLEGRPQKAYTPEYKPPC